MRGKIIRTSDEEYCMMCEQHNPSGKTVKFYDNEYYMYGVPLSFWEGNRKRAREYAIREISYQMETEYSMAKSENCLLTTKPNGTGPYCTLTVRLDDRDLEQIHLYMYKGDSIPF